MGGKTIIAKAGKAGWTVSASRYANSGGGGINLFKNGVMRFAIDYHKYKLYKGGPYVNWIRKSSPSFRTDQVANEEAPASYRPFEVVVRRTRRMEQGRMEPEFPIYVRFEDGEVEEYDDVTELIEQLEDFDSDIDTACDARDARGRAVRLKLKLLELKELSLA